VDFAYNIVPQAVPLAVYYLLYSLEFGLNSMASISYCGFVVQHNYNKSKQVQSGL